MGIVPKCLNFICYYMVKDFFKILTDKHTFIYTHIHIYLGTCYVYHISHLKTQTPLKDIDLGFPDSSLVKNLPAMQETPFRFPGQEDPLEKG